MYQKIFTSKEEVLFMNTNYNSVYGLHIKQFIETKRKFGFKFKTPASILGQIDRLAAKRTETSAGITKEFAQTWGIKQLCESDLYQYTRVGVLAQFSSYLCDTGIISYIPKLPPPPKCTFIPYIFSPAEMNAIFKACDKLRLSETQMGSAIISIPVLIRLLYSTGLRISEALALRNEDVNLRDKYLRVKDCKNGKERIIPISNSLVSACKEYVKYRCQLPLGKIKSGYFFVKLNGSKCSDQCVRNWFKECLNKAAIRHIEGKHSPRVHDLSYPNKNNIQTFMVNH